MSYAVREIEGVGPKYAAKLNEAGIRTTEAFLEATRTPKQRAALADSAEIRPDLVLTWANRADLMRIKGVGGQFAELLNVAGVDTVKELARRNPANLHAKLVEVNAVRAVTRGMPNADKVAGFVAAAGELAPILEY